MDVIEIRYGNFKALFERYKAEHPDVADHGAVKRFSEYIGISERQVSFLRTKSRNVGPATARRMEEVFGLPKGWMDVRHDSQADPKTSSERKFIEAMLTMYRKNPELALLRAAQFLSDSLTEQAQIDRLGDGGGRNVSKRN
jgi:plasmid maintenance system antidote protein VapI